MFRENEQHLQLGMFDTFQQLPEKVRQRLEGSWAGTFYREVFCRVDESLFAVLYSDKPSRPNAPINILVSTEILKAGFGWSDEELHDEVQFNLQIRYALGLRDMSTVPFELRTLYYFRHRLSKHMQETGQNLLAQVFEQVTDEQLKSLKLKTGQQRMDSVLVSSNIRDFTRLHLLVEVIQRVWRMLSEADQTYYAEPFEPYCRGTAGQFCYYLKGEKIAENLRAVGCLMHRLLRELEAQYDSLPTYQMLQRVFNEHFALVDAKPEDDESVAVRPKVGKELKADSLQSPDDWEATFREKRGQGHRGYIANLTETCDPENKLQLITQVQVDSNLTDDAQMAVAAVPGLKARTDLEELWTDGGYTGSEAEDVYRKHKIRHVPTNLRGGRPSPDRLGLEVFSWGTDEEGNPQTVYCPGGQQGKVKAGFKEGRFLVSFDSSVCDTCSWADQCRAEPVKLRPERVLRVTSREVQVAQLRLLAAWACKAGNNLRSAIESTVRSVTHPFGGQAGKLPVRGKPRVTQVIICSALMVNLRRIWRYEHDLAEKASENLRLFLLHSFRGLRSWFHRRSVRRFRSFGLVPVKC
jgi:hypothetical protein